MLSEVGNDLSPVMDPISSLLIRRKCRYFSLDYVTGSCRPGPPFLTGIVLEVPSMGEIDSDFPKKIQGKRFPKEYSPVVLMGIPCLMSRVAKIPILIGLHKPPKRNSPGDISCCFGDGTNVFFPF